MILEGGIMNKELNNLEQIQKKLKRNHLILIEFVYDLTIIVTKDNIYLSNWEEGNYSLKNNLLLALMSKEQKKEYKFLKCWCIEEDIKERYEILDHIFETCKYTTVKCW